MEKRFVVGSVLVALISLVGTTVIAQEQKTRKPERIAPADLKKKIDSGEKLLLIDVREDWEIKQDGAIPGATHIPMAELDNRMKDIPKDVELVFY